MRSLCVHVRVCACARARGPVRACMFRIIGNNLNCVLFISESGRKNAFQGMVCDNNNYYAYYVILNNFGPQESGDTSSTHHGYA